MKLLVWDLVIGLHAALIEPQPTDDKPEQVAVRASEIDVGGGDDADFASYEFAEEFFEECELIESEARAVRDLQESMVSSKEPFACDVDSLADAKDIIAKALHARGGTEVDCDGMGLSAFRCVQGLVASLDGNLDKLGFTLALFTDAPAAPTLLPDAPALPPETVANHGLADW